jgi:phosphoribosylamine--glycine ligase
VREEKRDPLSPEATVISRPIKGYRACFGLVSQGRLLPVKILVVGSGGREHALAWKLRQSPGVDHIFCAPGNAGTAELGENVDIKAGDLPALAGFAKQNRIDLTVVGPDDSLAAGIADLFASERLRIFGPTKSAARLESSKIFAKELMRAKHIPTARAAIFEKQESATAFLRESHFPIVIKADGLALGKGVIVAKNVEEAQGAVDAMMSEGRFGGAGRRLLIEECLAGSECSLHALVDGNSFVMLASARDHKRAFDGDAGPNTGGMGAFSPANNFGGELQARFESEVMRPLLEALEENGIAFRGLLFPGLMITVNGARVLEFNCRFGDPETQAILPRLKSDLLPLLEATIDGRLDRATIEWDERPAVTVVMASGGYPDKYDVGKPISGLESAASENVQIFHAGTRRENGEVVTSGGRVLAVTALGETIAVARDRAYKAVSKIHFDHCHYRRDIALSAVGGNLGSA